MITTGAVLHGNRERLLGTIPPNTPSRCSWAAAIGGVAQSARIARTSFDEINLNVGCPSDVCREGRFGACLMREPELVGDCVAAMKAAVRIRLLCEVPHRSRRAGPGSCLDTITRTVVAAGNDALIVHARKAGSPACRRKRTGTSAARLRSGVSAQASLADPRHFAQRGRGSVAAAVAHLATLMA